MAGRAPPRNVNAINNISLDATTDNWVETRQTTNGTPVFFFFSRCGRTAHALAQWPQTWRLSVWPSEENRPLNF